MRFARLPAGLLAALLFGLLYVALAVWTEPSGTASATEPVRVVTTSSYAVSLTRDPRRVLAGGAIDLEIGVHTLVGDLPMSASAEAYPETDGEGDAHPIALKPAGRNRYTATVVLPQVGAWEIDVDAATPGNPPERAAFTVPVVGAQALPEPIGWALALLPLVGLALFARAETLRFAGLPPDAELERLPLTRG